MAPYKTIAVLASALSGNAYMLSGPAAMPMRASFPTMNFPAVPGSGNFPDEATRDEAPKAAPKSGWTLTMAGGVRTLDDVYAAQKKAKKAYNGGQDGKSDLSRYQKGWTTN